MDLLAAVQSHPVGLGAGRGTLSTQPGLGEGRTGSAAEVPVVEGQRKDGIVSRLQEPRAGDNALDLAPTGQLTGEGEGEGAVCLSMAVGTLVS